MSFGHVEWCNKDWFGVPSAIATEHKFTNLTFVMCGESTSARVFGVVTTKQAERAVQQAIHESDIKYMSFPYPHLIEYEAWEAGWTETSFMYLAPGPLLAPFFRRKRRFMRRYDPHLQICMKMERFGRILRIRCAIVALFFKMRLLRHRFIRPYVITKQMKDTTGVLYSGTLGTREFVASTGGATWRPDGEPSTPRRKWPFPMPQTNPYMHAAPRYPTPRKRTREL